MNALPPAWISYTQLIQDLIGGTVRRNLFTQPELNLLLDVQMARKRKSSRADALRRYLRIIQQGPVNEGSEPLSFADFLANEPVRRAAASAS